jgi:PAS domain S-box-containing protein
MHAAQPDRRQIHGRGRGGEPAGDHGEERCGADAHRPRIPGAGVKSQPSLGDGHYCESRIDRIRLGVDPERVKLRHYVQRYDRRAELLIPLVLLILAVPVGLLIYNLDQRADALRHADHLVRSLDTDSANIRALEWKARALKSPTPALLNEAVQADLLLRAHLDSLTRNGSAPNVVLPAHRYEAAYAQLLVLASTGDLQASGRAYAAAVAPAERRLGVALATETVAIERASEEAQNKLMIGTIAGLLAAAALVLLLSLRINRFRAAQNLMLAEAERQMRHAEQLYRTLVERLPGFTYISGLDDSGLDFVSPQVESMLGYRPDEWKQDPTIFLRLIHSDDRERITEEGRILRQGTGARTFEYRMVARDGHELWMHDDAVVVCDEAGRPSHVQGFVRDVTLIKLAQEQHEALLEQERAANDKLRQLDAMKDEFVALVSHELRTPLTSIVGYVELLLERGSGDITEEQERYLQVVARNSHRLQRLVGDLLFIARYHAGKFEIDLSPIDVGALGRECVVAALPTAEASGVELVCTAKEPVVMSGDQMRIAQLLDNLVSNALKFTPRGGRVEVRARQERDAIVIEVADTGAGIPAERFFRTPEATKQAIQGTGLGLAISRAIVEAHGGEIGVESAEDVGTTFRVTFPRAAAQLGLAA